MSEAATATHTELVPTKGPCRTVGQGQKQKSTEQNTADAVMTVTERVLDASVPGAEKHCRGASGMF